MPIKLLLLLGLGAGVWLAPVFATGGGVMAVTDPMLVGAWDKTAGDACAAQYAAHLRFEPTGLYFGTTEPPGSFTWWDGGTWRVAAPGRLSLATANDAVVTYDYDTTGDQLTITDASGCQVTYRRS